MYERPGPRVALMPSGGKRATQSTWDAFVTSLKRYDPELRLPDMRSVLTNIRSTDDETIIWANPDSDQSVYLLLDGVAFTFNHLVGGRRHIEDFFGPGSICNWGRIDDPDFKPNLQIKRGAKVAVLDPSKFTSFLDEHAALNTALKAAEDARRKRLWQRIRTLIALPASHRVTIYLLDLIEEFFIPDASSTWIPYYLTQEEMADLLGLTEVHVNRVLSRMEKAGEIERKRGRFRLTDPARLRRQLHYEGSC
ncbi:Crp/Fnr family transcriptional regulator [Erythrobacter sp.]|jgi:CRP-like cAMP-binding protein|uniref:Crp/Fnr family transcriptional regulator n=1 Tax=Erythrobacter sp. TaxID=1042 RepID=UPI002EBFB046|nr:Crp/Fnr family transcriptional regulator [Erythrobacter sp.]